MSDGPTLTIDPNGSGGTDGNVIITGNLTVQGTTTTINSNVVSINDLVFNTANNASTSALATGGGIGVGPQGSEYALLTFNNSTTSWNTNIGISATGAVSGSGTGTFGNVATGGTISATGNITGGNISTGGAMAITGASTAGSYSTAGNVTGGNFLTGGLISATGAVTGAAITGSSLTVSTGNITAGNLLLSGAISDSAQLDIQTSAGNANIVLTPNGTGNVNTGANLSVTGNVTAGNISATNHTGTTVSVTGNVIAGNVNATLNGSGANVTSISATNISSGTLAQARLANAAVTLGSTALTLGSTVTTVAGLTSVTSTTFVGGLTGAATTAGTVTTAAQGNITSVGTLTALTVSGAITVNSSNAVTAIVNGGTTGVGNIGASGAAFNTVFAKATTAQYADLAENYEADAEYAPGTVLEFGGDKEVTLALESGSTRVAGVVSTNPAYLMNSELAAEHVVAIALQGRVPCRVVGAVAKGDMMVSAGNGAARADNAARAGTVIGKSLENFSGAEGTIEVVVGRN